MGRFIVIDGLDGSGKETQTRLLAEALEKKGRKVRVLSFPCYDQDSSFFVKMYLNGTLGTDPAATNAYAASSFFAADRYISYRTDWAKDYLDAGTIVIANRYTTANAVHQLSKLPEREWRGFLDWLWDYEFRKLGIPAPDTVLYLEMLPEISEQLIRSRSAETGRAMDIHELDRDHLKNSYRAALYCTDALGWDRICCYSGNAPRTRNEIHNEIMKLLHRKGII